MAVFVVSVRTIHSVVKELDKFIILIIQKYLLTKGVMACGGTEKVHQFACIVGLLLLLHMGTTDVRSPLAITSETFIFH